MTDWLTIARARGLQAPQAELERIAAVLEALETALAPLVRGIPLDTEPATVFRPAPGEEA
jgi:hypothetical protein